MTHEIEKLDQVSDLRLLDTKGMEQVMLEQPAQVIKCQKTMGGFFLPPNFPIPRKILIQGTGGGSAIAAGLVKKIFSQEITCPIFLNQGYKLPAWVDRQSLIFFISVSGNTEEILQTYQQAQLTQARLIGVTAGGELLRLCRQDNHPVVQLPHDDIQARNALLYLFGAFIWILERLGLIGNQYRKWFSQLGEHLETLNQTYHYEIPTCQNRAKQIAYELHNRFPFIYSTDTALSVVARRWKNQISENGKMLAHFNTLPAMNHDEIVGWECPGDILEHAQAVFLRDQTEEDASIALRLSVTEEIIAERLNRKPLEVYTRGDNIIERLFSLILLGDWISMYLAFLYDRDPTPVPSIVKMKQKINQIGNQNP